MLSNGEIPEMIGRRYLGRYINVKQLSEYIGIGKDMIYHYNSAKEIPYMKIGRRVVYDIKEIEKWLKSKRVVLSSNK